MKAKKYHGIIFVQAVIAMLWSLYYGFYWDPIVNMQTWAYFNALNALTPCELCWYARILMYPIVLISLVWILRKKRDYIYTVAVMSFLWLCLEIYHYTLQKFDIGTSQLCTYNNPCNALEVNYFWFVTIPFLCWLAFLIILISCIVIDFKHRKNK